MEGGANPCLLRNSSPAPSRVLSVPPTFLLYSCSTSWLEIRFLGEGSPHPQTCWCLGLRAPYFSTLHNHPLDVSSPRATRSQRARKFPPAVPWRRGPALYLTEVPQLLWNEGRREQGDESGGRYFRKPGRERPKAGSSAALRMLSTLTRPPTEAGRSCLRLCRGSPRRAQGLSVQRRPGREEDLRGLESGQQNPSLRNTSRCDHVGHGRRLGPLSSPNGR